MPESDNSDQVAIWNGDQGQDWAANFERYDKSLAPFQELLAASAAIVAGEVVLDVGCGNGLTSRQAAARTPNGHVVGVDISAPMLERARVMTAAEGHANVTFVEGDAQVYAFAPQNFDVVISRFGTMFFADKASAFANIFSAVKAGGRLALVTWQPLARNDQFRLVSQAALLGADVPEPPPGAPTPMGISDPYLGRQWLESAGFRDVSFEPFARPFLYGADVEQACQFALGRGFGADLDDADRQRALVLLRDLMESHATAEGVFFDSNAWVVTARRPRS